MDILTDLGRITAQLLIQEPFYAHFFQSVVRQTGNKDQQVSTWIESGRIVIAFDEEYWYHILKTDEKKYGAVKHQILHILFGHIARKGEFSSYKTYSLACDLVVNQYLTPEQLAEEAFTLNSFPQLDLRPNMPVDYYYDRLLKTKKISYKENKPGDENSSEQGSSKGEDGRDTQKTADLAEASLNQHNRWFDLDQVESQILKDEIDRRIEQAHSSTTQYGSLPQTIRDRILRAIQNNSSSIHWKRALKIFSNTSRENKIVSTVHRVSKRYGTVPGIKIRSRQKLLVALDTSASISDKDLMRFFGEIKQIHKQKPEIIVVECDTMIHREYIYKGKIPDFAIGRGGTCFEEPLKRANEINADGIIYFTDGYGPKPKVRCKCPLFWLIRRDKTDPSPIELPGKVVLMEY